MNRLLKRVATTPSRRLAAYWLVLVAIASLLSAGCTRAYYRRWADNEVYDTIRGKTDPRWPLFDYTINVDPQSRMYDPCCPDYEPEPPDDPTAQKMMKCVDGMRGDACWEWYGKTPFTQNPYWIDCLPQDDQNQVVVDLAEAVRLSLINSREYQQELEQLYLSALDVTFERFRFDVQFFGNNSTAFNVAGPAAPGSGGSSSSQLINDTSFQARKLFASGGELVVGLANSLVWEFSGSNNQFATTLLDFSLLQPLLRGGGRAVVLERLTLSERTLLYNVRAMERYRRGFFTQIYAGNNPGQGPQRRGGVFGGAGLEGFTGTGGGFGQVGAQVQQQQIAANVGVTGGAGAGVANGFLGVLQRKQQIRNQQSNVAALGNSVAQLDAAYDANRIDRFQVDLARQAFYNTQSQLMNEITNYDNTVDGFKLVLGLPPQLEMKIQDDMLAPFELIDPRIAPLQNRMTRMQVALGDLIISLREEAQQPDAFTQEAFRAKIVRLRRAMDRAWNIHQRAVEHIAEVQNDIDGFRENVPKRRASLELLLRRASEGRTTDSQSDRELDRIAQTEFYSDPDAIRSDLRQLVDLPAQLEGDLGELEKLFSKQAPQFEQIDGELQWLEEIAAMAQPVDVSRRLNAVLAQIPDELVNLYGQVLELSLVQARARTEKIVLEPIDMDSDDAIRIARCCRLDWMNARAALVDRWRLIEFNANALESELNLSISGDVQNAGQSPFALNGATGRLRLGLEFDAPLTRLAERNNYRQALIEYQQARRDYYAFTDRIAQSLRQTLRQIELNQANFELRRAAVRVAINSVEITQYRLREPPRPDVATTFNNTTARDLVTALADLLNVQNDFMSVWVNYQVQRLLLDFNLETMQLDANGMWIDPGSEIGQNGKECFGTCCDEENVLHAADSRCNCPSGMPLGAYEPQDEVGQEDAYSEPEDQVVPNAQDPEQTEPAIEDSELPQPIDSQADQVDYQADDEPASPLHDQDQAEDNAARPVAILRR